MNSEQPRISIIHQMARSGGTVICKCLASMKNVVLLSEIHPLGLRMFNPLDQADRWYGLLTAADADDFTRDPPGFVAAIQRIALRCEERGHHLLIRDWSHLDYTGVPYARPSYRSLLAESLQPHFRLQRHYTVRHPLDQWLSITRNEQFRKHLDPLMYLQGCLAFAQAAQSSGFSRYEDFTNNPSTTLREICSGLGIDFDPNYADRWQTYENITGDVKPGRSGNSIRALPRQHTADNMEQLLVDQPALKDVIKLLGYDDLKT